VPSVSDGNEVSDWLRSLLDDRGLGPGDRLPAERDLARELGISRPALREALRRLGALGLLEARPGSGHYVATVDLDDLLAVRLRLEPYAAGLAAARRTEADLQQLEELLEELAATESDPERFAAADVRLHRCVVVATRNPPLQIIIDALADLLRYSRTRTAPDRGIRSRTATDLQTLVQAIRIQDETGAEIAMRNHLEAVSGVLASGGDSST
jgi:GntR family transcriptional repressor for pyruvate dehydrogenase complex